MDHYGTRRLLPCAGVEPTKTRPRPERRLLMGPLAPPSLSVDTSRPATAPGTPEVLARLGFRVDGTTRPPDAGQPVAPAAWIRRPDPPQ
jgi:hypothetical protein